ncbi:MAG TPA: TonB family protein [Thermoanaerobaculia bacterium]|nr:TonB family protein [Thermoanaerobaculia bacterium]
MALPLEQLEGKYEILEKIREGGMGAIYKVRHVLLGEIRVVKVLRADLADREEAQERFIREARSAIRLRHPNIAQLHDFSLDDAGTGLIVMEYIDGLSFQDVLESHGPPGPALALEMALQSLRALEYLHRLGYVHRDISPDNLMLTRDVDGEPLVKLIDLGIAKGRSSGDAGVTSTGTVLGKIRYASPENFKSGSASVGARADVYSFGIVLYELLTGAYPIRGRDLNTILAGHLVQPVLSFDETDPDGSVHPELRGIVGQALEKDPAERMPSAERFWTMLHDFRKRRPPAPMAEGLLETILSGTPIPRATSHPSPGTTQGLLDREFPPEDTGSSPRPAHLDATGSPTGDPPPWRGEDVEAGAAAPPAEPPRGSGLIDRAWDLFDGGDLDEAERLLGEGLAATPGHPAERGLGERIAEAREQRFRLEAEAGRQKSRQLIDRAADAFEDGDLEACQALLIEAGRADPSDPLPAEEIARLREIVHRRELEAKSEPGSAPPRAPRGTVTEPTVVPVEASPGPPVFLQAAGPPRAVTEPITAQREVAPDRDPARASTPDLTALAELPEAYTGSSKGSLSPWVWSLPILALLLVAGGVVALRLVGGSDEPAIDTTAAAASSELPDVPPAPIDPSDPVTSIAAPAGRAPQTIDGEPGQPVAGAPAREAEAGAAISLTETFPILRTESREEAFSILRRVQAAGIRATVSRDPRDPLPYAVEAGPHQTAEEARLEARRARSELDRPTADRPSAAPKQSQVATAPAVDSSEEPRAPPEAPPEEDPPVIEVAVENPSPVEPAPVAENDEPIPVTGEVVAPELIDGPSPVYTRMARRAQLQGVVVLRTVIDEKGSVIDATVLKGLPMGLNESALNAVKRWRYRPATLRGEPVKVNYNVAVTFRLQ